MRWKGWKRNWFEKRWTILGNETIRRIIEIFRIQNLMINILLFIGAIGFISWQHAVFFNDVWLRNAQQKQLRQKFEDWWLTVADLDKLKLALACTIMLNSVLDKTFGIRLFSKRAFWRSSMAAESNRQFLPGSKRGL
jgi:hypothetical protein